MKRVGSDNIVGTSPYGLDFKEIVVRRNSPNGSTANELPVLSVPKVDIWTSE